MMTEGWSSLIAGHHPSSLDTMEWHTIPETNKPALPDIWKTSAGLNAARDATKRRFNGLRCDQYRVLWYTYQCWGFMHQGWSQLVQHGVPVATRCLVALQHLDTRILVELSWFRILQTNVKKAISPKDPGVYRVPGGTVITKSGRLISFSRHYPIRQINKLFKHCHKFTGIGVNHTYIKTWVKENMDIHIKFI